MQEIKFTSVHKWILFLIICVLLSACGNQEASGEASSSNEEEEQEVQSIEHELGETDVSLNPQRVVVLEQGFTEVVAELGVKPVGVADDDKPERLAEDTLAKIEGYTSVGRRSEPNLETIRMLNPDLIIADLARHTNIYEELSEIAPTIALKNDAVTYEETLEATTTIGLALGKQEETEQLITEHQDRVNEFQSLISTENNLVIAGAADDGSPVFSVQSTSFFLPSFFTTQGVPYALEENEETSYQMTIEQLLQIDPDILIITINEEETSVIEGLKDNQLWNKLSAVKNGTVYEVSHADWSRRRSIIAVNDILPGATEILKKEQ